MDVSWVQKILMSFVQGISEFFPISSSGCDILLRRLLGVSSVDPLFSAMCLLGAMGVLTYLFHKELAVMTSELLRLLGLKSRVRGQRPDRLQARRCLLWLTAAVPAMLAQLFSGVFDFINGSMTLVALLWILGGLCLFLSDRLAQGDKSDEAMTAGDALSCGIGYAIGAIPGFSQVGLGMCVGKVLGIRRFWVMQFALLVSLPSLLVRFLGNVVAVFSAGITIYGPVEWLQALLGAVFCALGSYIAISVMRFLGHRSSFGNFSFFCWGAGLFTFIVSLMS